MFIHNFRGGHPDDSVVVLSPEHLFVEVKTNGRKFNVGDEIYYIETVVTRERKFFTILRKLFAFVNREKRKPKEGEVRNPNIGGRRSFLFSGRKQEPKQLLFI
jgi:hypothetical protein